jgi:hypothetical protein
MKVSRQRNPVAMAPAAERRSAALTEKPRMGSILFLTALGIAAQGFLCAGIDDWINVGPQGGSSIDALEDSPGGSHRAGHLHITSKRFWPNRGYQRSRWHDQFCCESGEGRRIYYALCYRRMPNI